jgi:hypothetical protein
VAAPVIEVADCTESGNNTATTSWDVSYPAYVSGDLLCFHVASDATVTHDWSATGPNGETVVTISDSYGGTAQRISAFYFVGSATTGASTFTVTPSATEQWTAVVVKVPAGEFDSTTPVQATIGSANVTTAGTGLATPTWTAGAKADGKIVVAAAIDTLTTGGAPSGWTELIARDRGAVGIMVGVRNAATTAGESVASATFTKSSETHSVIGYVINAPALAVAIDTAGALTLSGQTADFSLTDLGENAWAAGAWASGAWATGAWDVAATGSDLTLDIDTAGALTVSGQSLTLVTSIATANGSLTLAGQSVLATANVALSNGSLTLDGQTLDTDLSADIAASIENGSLTLAGQSVTTGLNVALSHGSLTLGGQTLDPLITAPQAWATGAWAAGAWAANSWVGMPGADLDVEIDAGALTISGQSLTSAISVALGNGSLTIDGQAHAVSLNVALSAGALTLDGQTVDPVISADLFASIENGSLSIAGQSITAAFDVALSHGSLTLAGQTVDASIPAAYAWEPGAWAPGAWAANSWAGMGSGGLSVEIDNGSLTIAGQSATVDLSVAVDAGALTISGQDITPSLTVDQAWASGAWAYGAWANNSWQGMVGPTDLAVTIDAGALSIAGQATKFAWSVPWTEGQLTLTGQTVDTDLTTGLTVAIDTAGALSIAGQETKFQWTVPWDEGQLTLTGQTVAVELGDEIAVDIDAGELTIAGQAVTAATNVALANGSLTIAGQSLAYGLSVAVDAGALTLSGEDLTPDLTGPIDIEIDAGNLTISGQELAVSGIEAPRDPMIGGSGPTRDDRKKFKKWLEKKPYQPIDVEIEAGTLSISGQQVGVNLTDRKPFTISDDITRPLLRLPQKRKSVAVSVDIDKLIAEELRYAEGLEAQKRKKRRKQDEEILLLM